LKRGKARVRGVGVGEAWKGVRGGVTKGFLMVRRGSGKRLGTNQIVFGGGDVKGDFEKRNWGEAQQTLY